MSRVKTVAKAAWVNRKAEIAIVTAIVALVKPYIH